MTDRAVRRVLIYRLGSLGDMAIAVPSLRLVARAFPEAERRMLTNVPVHAKAPAAAAVLGGSGLIHGYFRYAVGTRNLLELARLVLQIRWWRPQVVVYLAAARGIGAAQRDLRFFRACGVKRVIGAPLDVEQQANFYGADPGSATSQRLLMEGNLEPEAARLARCVEELGDAELDFADSWSLGLTAEEFQKADNLLGERSVKPFAVAVGTKVQAKDWGRENWHALLTELAPRAQNRGLLLFGAAEEAEVSASAAAGWERAGGGPVLNLCGRLSARESAAALARVALLLCLDSGPMHLAASVGTPVVAIFAARNIPRQWFPVGPQHEVVYHRVECWGCGLETCIEQRKKCLMSISPEEVLAAVERLLARVGAQGEETSDKAGVEAESSSNARIGTWNGV